MPELTRRWFLGGALSLIAAQATQLPSGVGAVARELRIGNKPAIYGDGVTDDAAGLGALLRREPVLLPKSGIVINDHAGCTIHHGDFKINSEVYIPKDAVFEIEKARFKGLELPALEAFFCLDQAAFLKFIDNRHISWLHRPAKPILLRAHEHERLDPRNRRWHKEYYADLTDPRRLA